MGLNIIQKMKKLVLVVLLFVVAAGVQAQELQSVKLNKPDKNRNMTLMRALENRHSEREFSDRKLGLQELSDLLWAANGINRPSSGKRTAPSAMNAQEIDVYVCMEDGCYRYDAKGHQLEPVSKGDARAAVAGQQAFVKKAPVCVVLVADLSRFKSPNSDQSLLMGACDAGIVSQNISLFCTAAGLATVPRASMDQEALREALSLNDSQHLILNHPVGYSK